MNKSSSLPQLATVAVAVAGGSVVLMLIYVAMWQLTLLVIWLLTSASTYEQIKAGLTFPVYAATCILHLAVTQGLRLVGRAIKDK